MDHRQNQRLLFTCCRDVRLSSPSHLSDGVVRVLGQTEDGWIHLQLLTDELSSASPGVKNSNSVAGWNKIVFKDISGDQQLECWNVHLRCTSAVLICNTCFLIM